MYQTRFRILLKLFLGLAFTLALMLSRSAFGDASEAEVRFGSQAGTDTYASYFLSYWGNPKMPLVAGLSADYLRIQNRSLRAEVGWVLGWQNRVRHVLGVSMIAQATKAWDLGYGPFFGSTSETISRPEIAIGPTYTFDWKGLTVAAGVAVHGQGGVRPILQFGYLLTGRLL